MTHLREVKGGECEYARCRGRFLLIDVVGVEVGVSLLAEVEDDNGGLLLFESDIGVVRILAMVLVVVLVVLGVVVLIAVMGVDDVVMMFGV